MDLKLFINNVIRGKKNMNKKYFLCCVMIVSSSLNAAETANGRDACSPFEVIEPTGCADKCSELSNEVIEPTSRADKLSELSTEVSSLKNRLSEIEQALGGKEKKVESYHGSQKNPCDQVVQLVSSGCAYGINLMRGGWAKVYSSSVEKKEK